MQKIEKFNQVGCITNPDELSKLEVFEKPATLISDVQCNVIVSAGNQPGACLHCYMCDDVPVGSADQDADSVQIDLNMLVTLIKIKQNL